MTKTLILQVGVVRPGVGRRPALSHALSAPVSSSSVAGMAFHRPTLPLSNEHGRFFPHCNVLPSRQLAARVWQSSAAPTPQAHAGHGWDAQLRATVEEARRCGVTLKACSNGLGCTALMAACIVGNKSAVRHLLEVYGRVRVTRGEKTQRQPRLQGSAAPRSAEPACRAHVRARLRIGSRPRTPYESVPHTTPSPRPAG